MESTFYLPTDLPLYSMSSSMEDLPDGCLSVLDLRNLSEEAETFLYTNKDKQIKLGVLPVLILIGTLLNGLFIFVVYRVRYMRTSTNMYLISLALSDTLFLFTGIGGRAIQMLVLPIRSAEPNGRIGFLAHGILTDASYFASLFVITLVSLEKYYAVCRPLKLAGTRSIRRAVKNSVISWIIGIIVGTVSFVPLAEHRWVLCIEWPQEDTFDYLPDSYVTIYRSRFPNYNTFMVFCEAMPFLFTLFFNAIIYAKLLRALTLQVEVMETHGQNTKTTTHVRNLAIRMLIINGSVYFLLLAPYEIGVLINEILTLANTPYNTFGEIIIYSVNVGNYLIYINTIVNPVIYFVTNQRYRKAYIIALFGSKRELSQSTRVTRVTSTPGN